MFRGYNDLGPYSLDVTNGSVIRGVCVESALLWDREEAGEGNVNSPNVHVRELPRELSSGFGGIGPDGSSYMIESIISHLRAKTGDRGLTGTAKDGSARESSADTCEGRNSGSASGSRD